VEFARASAAFGGTCRYCKGQSTPDILGQSGTVIPRVKTLSRMLRPTQQVVADRFPRDANHPEGLSSIGAGFLASGPRRGPHWRTLSRTRSARCIFSGRIRHWRISCHRAWRSSISARSLIQEPAFSPVAPAGRSGLDCHASSSTLLRQQRRGI
jgi:hypothetical protein